MSDSQSTHDLHHVEITFGFVTNGANDDFLSKSIATIQDLHLTGFEIVIVGKTNIETKGIVHVPFDEGIKASWITRKKNLLAQVSNGEILLILHDYMSVGSGWTDSNVKELLKEEWDVAMCPITNVDGERFRDWVLWPFNHRILRIPFKYNLQLLIPYHLINLTKYMYISGSAILVRKKFLLENPLDESRVWGEGEDVEWSIRLRDTWEYRFFPKIGIRSLKHKDVAFREIRFPSKMLILFYAKILTYAPKRISKFMQLPY